MWSVTGNLSQGRSEVIEGIEYAPQHYTWDIIEKQVPEFYENSIKFSFVRNPYDRILSEYFWSTRPQSFNPNVFEAWIKKFLNKIDNDHKLTQTKFVPKNIDFLGKTETLNDDLRFFIEKYKLPFKHKNKALNTTKANKNKLIKSLTSDTVELIRKVYEEDFIAFNYEQ